MPVKDKRGMNKQRGNMEDYRRWVMKGSVYLFVHVYMDSSPKKSIDVLGRQYRRLALSKL